MTSWNDEGLAAADGNTRKPFLGVDLGWLHRLLVWVIVSGCSSFACPESPPATVGNLITISRWSGGVAPTVRYVTVTREGALYYEFVGLRPRCSHLSVETLKEIREQVEFLRSQYMLSDTGNWVDIPLLIIDLNDDQYRYALDRVPEDVEALTSTLDRCLTAILGEEYVPLLSSE